MRIQTFQDFDAFADSVRDADKVMMLQNPTRFSWGFIDVSLPGIHVQLGLEGGGNITEGQSLLDGYVLFIPLNHYGAHAANGTALDEKSIVILEPGCDFCIRCETAHDWCSIFVPTQELARRVDLADLSSRSNKMSCRMTRRNPQLAGQFRALAGSLITAAAHCPELESAPAATSAAEALLRVASLVVGGRQGGKPHQEGRPRLPRQEVIRRSKALLEERHGEPVLIGELAAAANVSDRTLRTAFHEYFGIAPVHYLKLRQLHQVHRALKAADPAAVHVSNVLVQHGVWDFGRFASRYRRLFGERPSETIRTKGR